MHKDVSSVSGTPGMQVRSIKGLLSEEVTPQSGTASTGISVRTPASTATAIMEEKKISEKESLHIQKSKEYLKLVTTDLEDYLRSLRNFANFAKFAIFVAAFPRKSLIFQTDFCENFEIAAVQKYANLVELEKCCRTHIFLQNFVLIQPRTSPPKIFKILQNLPIC